MPFTLRTDQLATASQVLALFQLLPLVAIS